MSLVLTEGPLVLTQSQCTIVTYRNRQSECQTKSTCSRLSKCNFLTISECCQIAGVADRMLSLCTVLNVIEKQKTVE